MHTKHCAPFGALFALCGAPLLAQAWHLAQLAPAPHARALHCGAYDLARSRLVVYGGSYLGSSGPATMFGDTWENDGAVWQQRLPANSPGPRAYASMAFDPVTSTTILFGGWTTNAVLLAETWRWDGVNWTLLQPSQSPPALGNHAMVTDLANSRIVLFGGRIATLAPAAATWTFDGTTWTQLAGPQPPARYSHDLAFDLNTGRVVLFGGSGDFGPSLPIWFGDTWELVADTWIQRQPPASPSARWSHRMAYDPRGSGILLHGGIDPFYSFANNDTWIWNGTTWQLLATSGPRVNEMVLQSDWANNRLVMFGGKNWWSSGGYYYPDTWTFSVVIPGSFAPFGSGCAGPQGLPVLTGGIPPTIGNPATLMVTPTPLLAVFVLGLSNTTSGGLALPLALAPLGMPGCSLFVSLDVTLTGIQVGGGTRLPMSIPYQPALVSSSFFVQAASLDPTANPLGLTVSNAVAATIGWQ